jgi:hypothetical protein
VYSPHHTLGSPDVSASNPFDDIQQTFLQFAFALNTWLSLGDEELSFETSKKGAISLNL